MSGKVFVLFVVSINCGRDHVEPFLAALGDGAKTMVVGKASYAVSDPTVTSQIISLAATGADTFVLFAQSRAAAQAGHPAARATARELNEKAR